MRAADALRRLLRQLDLNPAWRVGANDLVEAWRQTTLNLQEFIDSTEHAVFHMRSEAGASITKPKGWLINRLRSGFYAAPANFVSLKQQEQEKIAEAKSLRAQVMQPANHQTCGRLEFENEFQQWLDVLPPHRRAKLSERIMPELPLHMRHKAQDALLRRRLAEEPRYQHLVEGLDSEIRRVVEEHNAPDEMN